MANSLLILRFVWENIVNHESKLPIGSIQYSLINILKLVNSPSNEILISALEAVENIFSVPNNIVNFTPADVDITSSRVSEYNSPLKTPKISSKDAIEHCMFLVK